MNSIYSDFFQYLSGAYNYPLEHIEHIKNQLDILDKTLKEKGREEALNSFYNLIGDVTLFVQIDGKKYFSDTSALSQSLDKVRNYTNSFEEIVIESQAEERFYPQQGDSFIVKLRKRPKRWLQNIVWLAPRTKNLYYKIRKKETTPLNYKKHKVKKQQLAQLVFINHFLRESDSLYENTLENRQNVALQLKSITEEVCRNFLVNNKVDNEKHSNEIRQIKIRIADYQLMLKQKIEEVEKELNEDFEKLQLKFGTFEFPARRAGVGRLQSQRQKAEKKFLKILNSYLLTNNAVIDYTEFYKNIQQLLVGATKAFDLNNKTLVKRLANSIEASFVPLQQELERWVETHTEKDAFNTLVLRQNTLEKHIPDFTNAVLQIDLTSPFKDISLTVNNLSSELNTVLTIPSGADYEGPTNKKSLRKVNTKLILEGEYQTNIETKLAAKQRELTQITQKFLQKTNEIAQIIEFSIEYLETPHQGDKTEIALEFYNGIKRAQTKSFEVLKLIGDTKKSVETALQTINLDFILSLNKAIEPETILRKIKKEQIKHRLTQLKKSLNNYFHEIIVLAQNSWKSGKKAFHFIRSNYLNMRVLFGINEPAKSISNELSNYLSETEATINSLPLMYQKLFKPEALTKERLYIARTETDQDLNTALSAWGHHKFAPTCIVGEAGMGVTTTLNFFEQKVKEQYPVFRFTLDKQITNESDFLNFIQSVFADIPFESIEDLKEKLQAQEIRRIIILQNIHYFYGRYNNGFINIHSFLNLISITNSNVFWVCSAKQYSWDYLNYSIQISDYFAYIIQMKGLDKEQIIKTIDDRHLPSGYTIRFIERKSFKATRKFKNSSNENKQTLLRNDFFNALYKNTQGNIKLALLFWKMAVVNMDNEQFSFQLKEIDHSFLESLGIEKMATLHNILIHGGLSIKEHSKVLGIKEKQSASHLLLMENDAVIVLQNGMYQINPLLYKHVVDHLKAINFIY